MGLLVALTVGTGCARISSWLPLRSPRDPRTAGIVTPAERIAELQSFADEAGQKSAEEQRRVVGELTQSIRTEDNPLIRSEIIRALAKYPGEQAEGVLRAATSDPNREVRLAACQAWAARGGARAAAVLGQVLEGDDDTDVRLEAVEALGNCGDSAAVAALGPALEDSDPAMQYRAVLSLKQLTDEDFGNDVDRWRQYVRGEIPAQQPAGGIAERFRRMF